MSFLSGPKFYIDSMYENNGYGYNFKLCTLHFSRGGQAPCAPLIYGLIHTSIYTRMLTCHVVVNCVKRKLYKRKPILIKLFTEAYWSHSVSH